MANQNKENTFGQSEKRKSNIVEPEQTSSNEKNQDESQVEIKVNLNSTYGSRSRRSESFNAPWHWSELANDFYDKFNNQMTGGAMTLVTALKTFRTSKTIIGIDLTNYFDFFKYE